MNGLFIVTIISYHGVSTGLLMVTLLMALLGTGLLIGTLLMVVTCNAGLHQY